MAVKMWTLWDAGTEQYAEDWTVGPADAGGSAAGYSVRKRTLRGGPQDGVRVVEVDNGKLRFTVLPDRGMGIWRGWQGDVELGWQSPVHGPVHPARVPLAEPGGLGWLSGFDEFLCRCGLESNGAPDFDAATGRLLYPLHGKIANSSAHRVEVAIDGDTGEIAVTGIVDEARLYHNKLRLKSTVATRAGHNGLSIVDEVTNLSAENGELQLLYHINFGLPLLDPGAQAHVPLKTLVPRDSRAAAGVKSWNSYGNEEPGFTEQVYFAELAAGPEGATHVLLRNAHGDRGAGILFDKQQLPCFTLWKSTQAAADGYVTGLEPGTNFPNARSYEKEQGRVAVLKPGASRRFDLAIEVYEDAASVAQAEEAIAALQAGITPKIFDKPQPRWSSAG